MKNPEASIRGKDMASQTFLFQIRLYDELNAVQIR